MFGQSKNQLTDYRYNSRIAQIAIRDCCCSDIFYIDFRWPQFSSANGKRQESSESNWYKLR